MSDANPAIVQLWAQQRRGTVGCSVIALAIAVAIDAVAYLFAPSWLFWTLAVVTSLFVLLAVTSTIRELGRTRIFYTGSQRGVAYRKADEAFHRPASGRVGRTSRTTAGARAVRNQCPGG